MTVAPNYEYGQSAVKWFKQLLGAKRPDVEFVAEQWPALGRIDAGATVGALAGPRPDAIFNVTFGADLTNFVRQGNTRGLFEKRSVASMLTGEPEYLEPLGDETPEGWIVTGYPNDSLVTAEHKSFAAAYRGKFAEGPKCGSVVGYALVNAIVAGGAEDRRRGGGRDGRGVQGRRLPDAVRPGVVPRAGPPGHAGGVRGQAGVEGRQGYDGGLALRGRGGRAAGR